MAELISGPFAELLKRNRERINARFAAESFAHPQLAAPDFADGLRRWVQPALEQLSGEPTALLDEVLDALSELLLKLLARDLIGPRAAHAQFEELWRQLIIARPRLVREDPRGYSGALANGLLTVLHDGARPALWIELLAAAAERAHSVAALLTIGKVAAWRAGLAHYRTQALSLLPSLDPASAALLLGLAPETNLSDVLSRMNADPWLSPAQASRFDERTPRTLQLVARVGSFRGFGGRFREPPLLYLDPHGSIAVFDGERAWALAADCFGHSLMPLGRECELRPYEECLDKPYQLDRHGLLCGAAASASFPQFSGALSFAATPRLCAVTISRSHAVYLIAPRVPEMEAHSA